MSPFINFLTFLCQRSVLPALNGFYPLVFSFSEIFSFLTCFIQHLTHYYCEEIFLLRSLLLFLVVSMLLLLSRLVVMELHVTKETGLLDALGLGHVMRIHVFFFLDR